MSGPGHSDRRWGPGKKPLGGGPPIGRTPRTHPPTKKVRGYRPNVVGPMPRLISAAVAQSAVTSSAGPIMRSEGTKTVISHRELLGTIVSTGATFSVNNGSNDVYAVNPVDPGTFPWLSNIASSYDTYRFRRVRLRYVPLCATTTNGRVGLFYDKDSQDVGPFDRSELANYASCMEMPAWEGCEMDIPVSKSERFIKEATSNDAKLYDDGRVGWATYSTPAQDLGDVFVEYEVELMNPQPITAGLEFLSPTVAIGPIFVKSAIALQSVGTWTLTVRMVTGTFFFDFISDGTTLTSIDYSGIGNIDIVNNKYLISNTNRASCTGIITARDSTATLLITVNGTAVTNWHLFIGRGSRNAVITL